MQHIFRLIEYVKISVAICLLLFPCLFLPSTGLADTPTGLVDLGISELSTVSKELNIAQFRDSIIKAKEEVGDQGIAHVLDSQLLILDRYEVSKKALSERSGTENVGRLPKDFQGYEDLLSDLISADERCHSLRGLIKYSLKDLDIAVKASSQVEAERRRISEGGAGTGAIETIADAEIKSRLTKERLVLQQLEYRTLKAELELEERASLRLRQTVAKVVDSIRLPQETLESTVTALARYKQTLEKALTSQQEKLRAGVGNHTVLEQQVLLSNRRIGRIGRVISQWSRRAGALNNTVSRDIARMWLEDARRELEALDGATQAINLLTVETRKKLIAEEAKTEADNQSAALEELLTEYQDELLGIDAARILTMRLETDLFTKYGETSFKDWFVEFREQLASIWGYELFTTSDDRPVTTSKIVYSLLLLILGTFLSGRASRLLAKVIFPRFRLNQGAAAAFQSLLFYILLVAFSICALNIANVPLTVFTLLGGVLAIGVGFGSQALMNNFISGLIMLVEQPIRPGDLLEIEGYKGIVKRIGARSTIVLVKGNIEVVVPNSEILQKSVINWTLAERKIKVAIPISVAYDSDIEAVDNALLSAVKEHPKIIKHPSPQVELENFGESSLDFELDFWVELTTFTELDEIKCQVRRIILQNFRAAGINIPFPQREVRLLRAARG